MSTELCLHGKRETLDPFIAHHRLAVVFRFIAWTRPPPPAFELGGLSDSAAASGEMPAQLLQQHQTYDQQDGHQGRGQPDDGDAGGMKVVQLTPF